MDNIPLVGYGVFCVFSADGRKGHFLLSAAANARGYGCSVLFVLTVLLNESLGGELLGSMTILLTSLRTHQVISTQSPWDLPYQQQGLSF